jgi:hypothetical protein
MAASSGWRSNAARPPHRPNRLYLKATTVTPIVAERTEPKAVVSGATSAHGESLAPEELYRRCDPASLGFLTTDEVPESPITLGQDRAVRCALDGSS